MRLPNFIKSAGRFVAATGGPTRSDTYLVNVQIAHPTNGNILNYGTWDKMTGGEVQGNATSYRPGGMSPPISLGGQRTVTNVVVSRLYRLERDHVVASQIAAGVGRGRMIVTKQPLDVEGNTFGSPIVYQGRLDGCKYPDVDSEANAAGIIELTMVVEGYPSQ